MQGCAHLPTITALQDMQRTLAMLADSHEEDVDEIKLDSDDKMPSWYEYGGGPLACLERDGRLDNESDEELEHMKNTFNLVTSKLHSTEHGSQAETSSRSLNLGRAGRIEARMLVAMATL